MIISTTIASVIILASHTQERIHELVEFHEKCIFVNKSISKLIKFDLLIASKRDGAQCKSFPVFLQDESEAAIVAEHQSMERYFEPYRKIDPVIHAIAIFEIDKIINEGRRLKLLKDHKLAALGFPVIDGRRHHRMRAIQNNREQRWGWLYQVLGHF